VAVRVRSGYSRPGERHRRREAASTAQGRAKRQETGFMSATFDRVADIIAETSDIARDKITPDSHVIDDLGIDSLDFLDIVFAIDKAFGIKIPIEAWTEEVNRGEVPAEQYFVLKNLCSRIDDFVAAKATAS